MSKIKTQEEFSQQLLSLNKNIKIVGKYIGAHEKILCKCLIHNYEWHTVPETLLKGIGCPLCSFSKGEREIEKFLKLNTIKYIAQKTYENLFGINNGLLSYDFYLPNYNLLIEYQGEQHERFCKGFHKSKKEFEKQKEHDKRKREYAGQNNIKLLEIWYWDFDNIEEILNTELFNIK